MVKKNDSDSKQTVPPKTKEVGVSCFNCFTTELIDKEPEPVPLSIVRKENRAKFKLYSILASEISQPKAVPFKQKVSDNYSIGKKIEKKLTNDPKNIKLEHTVENITLNDKENLYLLNSVTGDHLDKNEEENSKSDIAEKNLVSLRTILDNKTDIEIKSPNNKKNQPHPESTNLHLLNLNFATHNKTPVVRNVSFGEIKVQTMPEPNYENSTMQEQLKKVIKTEIELTNKTTNQHLEQNKSSGILEKRRAHYNEYPMIQKPSAIYIKSNGTPKSGKPINEKNLSLKTELNLNPSSSTITKNTEHSHPLFTTAFSDIAEETVTNEHNQSFKATGLGNDNVQQNISDYEKRLYFSSYKEGYLASDKKTIEGLHEEKTEDKREKKDESIHTEEKKITGIMVPLLDGEEKYTTVNQESKFTLKIIQPKIKLNSKVGDPICDKNKLTNKTSKRSITGTDKNLLTIKEQIAPVDIIQMTLNDAHTIKQEGNDTDSKRLPVKIIENLTPYDKEKVDPIVEECNSIIEESKIKNATQENLTKKNCTTLSNDVKNNSTYYAEIDNLSTELSNNFKASNSSISGKYNFDKDQIENSTPKVFKNNSQNEMNPKLNLMGTHFKNEDADVDEIIEKIQNISLDSKEKPSDVTDKTDNASSNGSESGYGGASMRDLHDVGMPQNFTTKPDFTDYSEPSTPTPTKKDSLRCFHGNFKSSLPVLTANYKKNILKSSSVDSTDGLSKPEKSLRWSTLGLSQKSKNDEVYSGPTSPGHATLPRRSNSPLPHERDSVDRDRFSLNRSGLQGRSESMASVYSGAGEGTRGSVAVRGEVQLSLLYNYRLGALEVGVKRCRDLAPVDLKRLRSDPYVKVYLLPDKSKAGKRKTKVKKNTLNPVFEETLSFVQPLASLSARTLWLSVWHADMFGRNDFLGEVTLPLADVVFDDPAPTWHKLHERTEQFECEMGSRGELIVGLKLEVDAGRGATLHVLVKEAKGLQPTKPNGLADVFCKSYLLPERGRLAKQKTAVARRTLNPSWEHTFMYRGLKLQELSNRALELSLWDRDRLASNDFMGAVRLSLGTGTYMGASVNWMDSNEKESSLWQRMLQRPNFWVESCLPLRPQLNN